MFIANVGKTAVYLYKGEVAERLNTPNTLVSQYFGEEVDHRVIQVSDVPDDSLFILTSPAINVLTSSQISEIIKLNRKDIEGSLMRVAFKAAKHNADLIEQACEPVVVVLDPKEYKPAA